MDEAARTAFRARWREKIEGDPTKARLYKDIGAGIATAGIEYYLPLFFDADGDDLRLPRATTPRWCCTARSTRRCSTSGPTRASATASCSTTPSGRSCRRRSCSCAPRSSSPAPARMPRWRCAAPSAVDWARPLPDVSVDRGAPEPLAALERHIDSTPHRVLLVAESDGRRESLLELLRDHRIDPPSVATLAEFEAGDEKVAITAAPLAAGFFWLEPADSAAPSSSSPRPSCSPPRRSARRRRKQEQTSNVDALIKDLSELKVGDPVVHAQPRHRPLRGPDQHRPRRRRRRRQRVPAPRVRRQGHALRAGGAAAPDQPLHRRQRRRGAAAPAGLRPVGQGQAQGRRAGARHRGRAAEPVRPPRRARGLRVPLLAARLRGLRRQLRLRGNAPTSAPRSTR